MQRQYERGEGRMKHRWKYDYAGFSPSGKGPIGKCPRSITEKVATDILNQGVPFYDDPDDDMPSKIFSVHQGVVYEAVPTQPGVSWHGYPWRGDLRGRPPLPRKIRRQLEGIAKETGYDDEFKKWLEQYS